MHRSQATAIFARFFAWGDGDGEIFFFLFFSFLLGRWGFRRQGGKKTKKLTNVAGKDSGKGMKEKRVFRSMGNRGGGYEGRFA